MPPSTSRSSGCSTRVSISTADSAVTTPRSSPGAVRGSSATAADGRGERAADQRAVQQLRSPATSVVGQHLAEVDDALVHPAGVGDQHQHQPGRGQRDQLDVPDGRAGQRRVLDDGDLPGELGEQPDAAAQHVVEVDRAVEEGLHGPPLGRRQRLDLRRAGRRTAGSPCRWGCGRRWCAAGRCSPRPPARPCRCGPWRSTRRDCAGRRSSSSRRAPGCARSRRRSRAAPRTDAPRRSPAPPPHGLPLQSRCALGAGECQNESRRSARVGTTGARVGNVGTPRESARSRANVRFAGR